MSHIPAWKNIRIKQQENFGGIEENAINVSIHLASGCLKKSKRRQIANKQCIMQSENQGKVQKCRKRVKLVKSERQQRSVIVLKDQLRYLIDFYLEKGPDAGNNNNNLSKDLMALESVSNYVSTREKSNLEGVSTVWKFSKQKQNWVLKHMWDIKAIPVEYNSLLQLYLFRIGGSARDTLVKRCHDIVCKWNKHVQAQEEAARGIAESLDETNVDESVEKTPVTESVVPCSIEILERSKLLLTTLDSSIPQVSSEV